MTKSMTSDVVEPTRVEIVAAPTPVPVVVVADIDKVRRAALEKELQGLRAKLRWTHITDGAHAELSVRATVIEQELKA